MSPGRSQATTFRSASSSTTDSAYPSVWLKQPHDSSNTYELPVATQRSPVSGSTDAPPQPQMLPRPFTPGTTSKLATTATLSTSTASSRPLASSPPAPGTSQ